jgi:hypothetical protein
MAARAPGGSSGVGSCESVVDHSEQGILWSRLETPSSEYGYTDAIEGTKTECHPYDSPAPDGTTVAGDYHTHGDYSMRDPVPGDIVRTDAAHDRYNSDNFSDGDISGIRSDGAGIPGYKGYLGTPSGVFKVFDPASGSPPTVLP